MRPDSVGARRRVVKAASRHIALAVVCFGKAAVNFQSLTDKSAAKLVQSGSLERSARFEKVRQTFPAFRQESVSSGSDAKGGESCRFTANGVEDDSRTRIQTALQHVV